MSKRVAVVTDAISTGFYFPLWYKYYANEFGSKSLHVATVDDEVDSFNKFALGSVTSTKHFNNVQRLDLIVDLVNHLLQTHDLVCRVDTDEFLVADPARFRCLRDYLELLEQSHVTAYGFNIIPDRHQPPLDLSKPILFHQRNLAYPYDALCKTCITSKPLQWSPGFHFCSEPPMFGRLFLFHTKLPDLDMQVAIGEKAASLSNEIKFVEYHRTPRAVLDLRLEAFRKCERLKGHDVLYRKNYIEKFLSGIAQTDVRGRRIYHGRPFSAEPVLVEITSEFERTF